MKSFLSAFNHTQNAAVEIWRRSRGEGDSAYERGGDARRKFCIKPLKETDVGVAQAFFDPLKETMLKHRQYYIFILNETFTAKYDDVLPRTT